MPPCQTLQVLSISWMLLAQCSRKRLVKWSFRSQKLRRSIQNAGRLIRAPARSSGRRSAAQRTREGVEEREKDTLKAFLFFLQTWFGIGGFFSWPVLCFSLTGTSLNQLPHVHIIIYLHFCIYMCVCVWVSCQMCVSCHYHVFKCNVCPKIKNICKCGVGWINK